MYAYKFQTFEFLSITFLFGRLESWRRNHILKRKTISATIWLRVLMQLKFLKGLTPEETTRLRQFVIREFAHKLDMCHLGANGYPILHANMSTQVWHDIFRSYCQIWCVTIKSSDDLVVDTTSILSLN